MLATINKIFNPFYAVGYRDGYLTHSRTLHTSFAEKLRDTFQVIAGGTRTREVELSKNGFPIKAGSFTPFYIKSNMGLFDYATLFTFRIIHALDSFFTFIIDIKPSQIEAQKNKNILKAVIYTAKALAFIPFFAFTITNFVVNNIVRQSLSGILTLALSPLVLISHGLSKAVLHFKVKQAEKLKLPPLIPYDINDNRFTTETTILTALKQSNSTLDNVTVARVPEKSEIYLIPNKKDRQTWFKINLSDSSIFSKKLIEINQSARNIAGYSCAPRYK
jgi:hypothetical protein